MQHACLGDSVGRVIRSQVNELSNSCVIVTRQFLQFLYLGVNIIATDNNEGHAHFIAGQILGIWKPLQSSMNSHIQHGLVFFTDTGSRELCVTWVLSLQ